MALEAEARTRLLGLARRSILDGLGQCGPPPLPREAWSEALNEPRATFVTLKLAGELRGCRGTLEARCPLAQDLWRNAWFSAYADPRFRPVSGEEIARLEVAISVLTALTPLHVASETELLAALRPGIDGLVLRCGAAAATFLPAVWEESRNTRLHVQPRHPIAHCIRHAVQQHPRLGREHRLFVHQERRFGG